MRETTAPTCARHPKVVTYLKCAACGTPICPDCFVESPVGYKCRRCGIAKNLAVSAVTPLQALAAFAVGLFGGLLAGWVGGVLGFFTIWLALPYGRFLGLLIMKASGQKMGLTIELIAGVSIILGGLFSRISVFLPVLLLHPQHAKAVMPLLIQSLQYPLPLIVIVVVAAVAISRIRNLWSFWGF